MKLNLKSTIAAPASNKSGQRALNGIIGNTRRGIVIDKTLDPDSNNPVANKPVSTALAALAGELAKGQVVFLDQLPESGEPHKVYVLTATNQRYWWNGSAFVKIVLTDIKDSATIKHTLAENKISLDLDETIKGKIDAALQKPAGLTKTELVGVGTNGQENIEIGDNLTLANGKLSASGGGGSIGIVKLNETQFNAFHDGLTFNLTEEQYDIIKTNDTIIFSFNQLYEGEDYTVTYSLTKNDLTESFGEISDIFYTLFYTTIDTIRCLMIKPDKEVSQFSIDESISVYTKNVSIDNDKLSIGNVDNGVEKYTPYYLAKINGKPIISINDSNYIVSESKPVPLFAKYNVLVPKDSSDTNILPLPADASTSTYVLKAVNGTVQWVKES